MRPACPPLCLQTQVLDDGRELRVVRDDRLFAGSKQRGLAAYAAGLKASNPGMKTLLYTGPTTGTARWPRFWRRGSPGPRPA
jgi:hypothetical protein